MLIKNIIIENFQSYYGSHTLEFSSGLNLIIGKGGKGKSKLFNAFYWVLFGKIYITEIGWCTTDGLPMSAKGSMRRHEFINKKALHDAEIDSMVKTSVQIEIEDDKGKTYLIERTVTAKRKRNDDWDSDQAWDVSQNILKVSYDSPTGTIVRTDFMAEDIISDLFPEGIRNYIWFQGESLESLINFRNKETLKSAVKHISYFPYYEKLSTIITRAKERIEKQESSARKAANKHNNEVNAIIASIDTLRYKIKTEEAKKIKLKNDIDTISLALTTDEAKMSGLASFTELVSKYKTCEIDQTKVLNKIFAIDDYQRKQLTDLWILRGITPMLSHCKKLIEEYREEENTLPEKKYLDNPSRSKLEEIIHDKVCFVCGSPVEEGNKAYHYIMERMKLQDEYLREMEEYTSNLQINKQFSMFIGNIQDYPDKLSHSIDAIDKQYNDSSNEMEKYTATRKKIKEEKDRYDIEIEEAKKKYGVDPVRQAETAGILKSGIQASRGNLEKFQRDLEITKSTLRNYYADLRSLEAQYEELKKKDSSVKSVPETEWKNISVFLEDVCKRVQENARQELLRKIELRANEFYEKFTEHDNGYRGNVQISDDYTIEFDPGLNTSHDDRKKMSIINALLSLNQEAMSIYYPFISDAPTSNFDTETAPKYLLGIKDVFGQSIIMTKDVDINSNWYKTLSTEANVNKIYSLESERYCEDGKTPDLHEVSTKVVQIKPSRS